jgi:hypothetical protein
MSDIKGNFFLILFFKKELIDLPIDPLEHKYLRLINLWLLNILISSKPTKPEAPLIKTLYLLDMLCIYKKL